MKFAFQEILVASRNGFGILKLKEFWRFSRAIANVQNVGRKAELTELTFMLQIPIVIGHKSPVAGRTTLRDNISKWVLTTHFHGKSDRAER